MTEPFIKAGEEFWNESRTEGYRITMDIDRNTPIMATQFEPLGEAVGPAPGVQMPEWTYDIFAKPGGVENYRAKQDT